MSLSMITAISLKPFAFSITQNSYRNMAAKHALCLISIYTASRTFLWERLVLGADRRYCFTSIEALAEKFSQRCKITAGMVHI